MFQAEKSFAFGSLLGLLLVACSNSDSQAGKIETKTVNGVTVTAGQGAIPDHVKNPPATASVKPVDAQMHKSEPPPPAPAAPATVTPAATAQQEPGHEGHNHPQQQAPVQPAAPADPNKPAPKISFKEKEWNFGTVIEGDPCVHSFEFKNEGPGELILTNVQPSCGCTAKKVTVMDGDAEKDYTMGSPIPAGAVGKIEATLNTQNIHGTKSSRITVVSNDPQSPSLALQVQAMVEQFFQLEPPNIYQNQIFSKSGAEATMKVTCLKAEEFEVTGYEKIPEGLELEFVKPDPAKKNYGEIKVKFKAGLPEGVFNQQIVALTKVPGVDKPRSIRFIVSGTVLGPIQVQPYLSFGLTQKGKSQTQKLTIQNRDPKFALEVSDVTIDSPQKEFLTAVIKKEMEGQTFVIELTVNDKCPPGVFKGTLTFKTNHPEKPEHKTTFSGVVR